MPQEEWCTKYQNRLVEKGGVDDGQAFDIMSDNYNNFDFSEDPEEAADMEMSSWHD